MRAVTRIDQIVKWAFDLGASAIESKSPHKASKLRQASAHWLRHSYVTYLLDSGAPLKVAQENAGHSNILLQMKLAALPKNTQENRFACGFQLDKASVDTDINCFVTLILNEMSIN